MTSIFPGWPSAWNRPSSSSMRPYASETRLRMRLAAMRLVASDRLQTWQGREGVVGGWVMYGRGGEEAVWVGWWGGESGVCVRA
jgi:hypothetical protein